MELFAISKEIPIPHADETSKFKILGREKKKKGGREDCAHLSVLVSLVVGELI